MNEGKLKKEIDRLLELGADIFYSSLAPKNAAEAAGTIRVGIKPSVDLLLNETKKDLDSQFDENEPMWKEYLSAEKGATGDYPDEGDFMLWLVVEVKKLLIAKKKWFGDTK